MYLMQYFKNAPNNWERSYSVGNQINLWPFSNFVSLFRNFESENTSTNTNILELGCGAGANSQIFINTFYSYLGIDFSQSAIKYARRNYQSKNLEFLVRNLNNFKPKKKFGIIFDRAALTHLNMNELEKVKSNVLSMLEMGGLYIGVDWFSNKHPDRKYASVRIDKYTYSNFIQGQFKEIGQVQFFNRQRIHKIFSKIGMEKLNLDLYDTIDLTSSKKNLKNSRYNLVFKKVK